MTFSPSSQKPPDATPQASPWWQTAAFLVAAGLLLAKAPYTAAAIVCLSFVIFFHELGHFLMARRQGMRVEIFSIGFGPALVKTERGGTIYQIAAIPLGGYVKPAGEDPKTDEDILAAKPDEFMGRPWWSRALVVLAGPVMNLILPVAALFLAYSLVGRGTLDGPPLVSEVSKPSGAFDAGMLPEDQIVKLNGQQVTSTRLLASLVDKISRQHPGQPLAVEVVRKGRALTLKVLPTLNKDAGKYLMGVKVMASPPPFSVEVASVGVLTPAEKAGFRAGDAVLSVDGQPLKDGFAFSALFAKSAHDPVPMKVSRGAQVLELSALKKQPVPDEYEPELLGLLGLEFKPLGADRPATRERLNPWQALKAATRDTAFASLGMALGIRDLVKGKLSARDSLGGPVAIMRMAAQQAKRGWEDLLMLMCNISLTLGFMNLLPLPVLDGGTFVFCLVEGLRRKPLKLKTQIVFQNVGLALIGTLFAFTLVNDLLRLVGR